MYTREFTYANDSHAYIRHYLPNLLALTRSGNCVKKNIFTPKFSHLNRCQYFHNSHLQKKNKKSDTSSLHRVITFGYAISQ